MQKILVIEDNEQDQKIIKRYLAKSGYTDTTIVESGELGVTEATKLSPEIILVDTQLPGINGFETCLQLKSLKELHSKIIMMTGQIDVVDAAKARRMGADDYCVKTSDCSALLETIKKVIGRSSAESVPKFFSSATSAGQVTSQDANWGLEKTNEAIKTLYKELELKNTELKELDHLKSKFISMVSHELRTPLTIIQGAVSQIEEGLYGPVNDDQKKRLVMAFRAAERLKYIINDLLDVVKFESKQIKLKKESMDLTAVVREVSLSFHSLAEKKGLKITMSFSREPLNVTADRYRIIQILTNLIDNSLKFTRQGQISITVNERSDSIECKIADTGCGISAENLLKVFGRFQQFGDLNAPEREGTGLGLSICKDLVELHNGTIEVESILNKGTTFIFILPKV